MSDFKDFSLPELYSASSPQAPGQVNWKSVAIYAGISVSCVIVFAIAIHISTRANLKMLMMHAEKMNATILAGSEQNRKEISAPEPDDVSPEVTNQSGSKAATKES